MMEDHAGICGLGDALTPDLLTHPDEVISEGELSEFEKQAILTDWASDARAVEDAPELRQLDNGAFVHIGDVLKAPKLLDNAASHMSAATRLPVARRRRAPTGSRTFENEPDDDGPPPCAAGEPPTLTPFLVDPSEILSNTSLSLEQKRAVLTDWLSDVHAVSDAPRWRQLDNGAFLDAEDLRKALRVLDDAER
jgi:hypothetical protein